MPQAARHSWSKALTRALAAVARSNTDSAWRELLMLPQTALDPPPRGGKKHKKALAAYTLDRLQRWHEGERAALWHSRHVPTRPTKQKARSVEQKREWHWRWRERAGTAKLVQHCCQAACVQTPRLHFKPFGRCTLSSPFLLPHLCLSCP